MPMYVGYFARRGSYSGLELCQKGAFIVVTWCQLLHSLSIRYRPGPVLTLPIRISAFLTGPRSPGKWWIRNSAHVYLILLYLVAVLDPPLGSALPTGLGDKWTLPWSSGIHTSLTVLIVLPRVGAVHSVTSVSATMRRVQEMFSTHVSWIQQEKLARIWEAATPGRGMERQV